MLVNRSRIRKTAAWIGGTILVLFAGYWLALAVVLPWLVRREIAGWQQRTPRVSVTLQTLSVDPWRWRVRLRGLNLKVSDRPFVDVAMLDLNVDPLFQKEGRDRT